MKTGEQRIPVAIAAIANRPRATDEEQLRGQLLAARVEIWAERIARASSEHARAVADLHAYGTEIAERYGVAEPIGLQSDGTIVTLRSTP